MRWNIEAVLDRRARWSRERMVRVARTRRATFLRARDGMVNFSVIWFGIGGVWYWEGESGLEGSGAVSQADR